jgi:hypothetical protein
VALHEAVEYDASSSFAILWSLACALFPNTIIDDFAHFIETLAPNLQMDAKSLMVADLAGKGTCYIDITLGKYLCNLMIIM